LLIGGALKFLGQAVIVAVAIFLARPVQRDRLFMDNTRGKGLAGQRLDERAARGSGDRGRRGVTVGMAVIVVLEIFENVADVEEGITI